MSARNSEEYIEKCITSILNQTLKNFEFIIVDDASTDNTLSIIKKFAEIDKRIQVKINKQNIGLTKSLNNALKLAKCEYIARQDADDYSATTRLEKQFNFLEENKEIALVGTSATIIDDEGEIICERKVLTKPEEIRLTLKKQNCIFHGAIMFRKEAVQKIGGYRELFKYGQDYDLYFRLCESNKISGLAEPLYFWRFSKSSLSFNHSKVQHKFGELARLFSQERLNKKKDSYGQEFIEKQLTQLNLNQKIHESYEYQKIKLSIKSKNFNFNKKNLLKHPSLLLQCIYYSLKK